MSEHMWVQENLDAYVAGELTAQEGGRLERHLDGCTECAEALRQAISEMEEACSAAAAGPPVPGAKTRLRRLRNDVDVLAHWVDAAMAFARGLALRTNTEELAHSEVKG